MYYEEDEQMAKHLQRMPSRYVCNVLEDMRNLDKARNYSGLAGLIEEAQTYYNVMESSIESYRDLKFSEATIKQWEFKCRKHRAERYELKNELEAMREEKKTLEAEISSLKLKRKPKKFKIKA